MTTGVLQPWLGEIPMMQQTVLIEATRGPDTLPKYHPTKYLLRWLRRCILYSAMDGKIFDNPLERGGGSFTGPSSDVITDIWETPLDDLATAYIALVDEVPHHFHLHFMHAAEILGYKHPDSRIKRWWLNFYLRLAHDMHLWPESADQMDKRLGDSVEGWLARADKATVA